MFSYCPLANICLNSSLIYALDLFTLCSLIFCLPHPSFDLCPQECVVVQCGEHQRTAWKNGPGALPDGGRGHLSHPTPGAHSGSSGRWVSEAAVTTQEWCRATYCACYHITPCLFGTRCVISGFLVLSFLLLVVLVWCVWITILKVPFVCQLSTLCH